MEICISDTGVGIDPQFLPSIFDRFSQADSSSTRRYGGLGLAIVRHLAEMHGGSVSASSPGKGKGSTFKVRFPAASPARSLRPENRAPESDQKQPIELTRAGQRQKLSGARVLVVEDDPDTLDMLRFILDKWAPRLSPRLRRARRWRL